MYCHTIFSHYTHCKLLQFLNVINCEIFPHFASICSHSKVQNTLIPNQQLTNKLTSDYADGHESKQTQTNMEYCRFPAKNCWCYHSTNWQKSINRYRPIIGRLFGTDNRPKRYRYIFKNRTQIFNPRIRDWSFANLEIPARLHYGTYYSLWGS